MAEEELNGSGVSGDSPTDGPAAPPPAATPPPPIMDDEAEGPSGIGAFVGPTINAIVAPAQCWKALDAKPKLSIWMFVWVALVSTILAVWNLPVTKQATIAMMTYQQRAQGQEVDLDQLTSIMGTTMTLMAYIGTSVFIFIMILFLALLMWLGASVLGGSGKFSRSFGLATAGAIIHPVMYSIYASIIIHMNPPEIRRPQDMIMMTPTVGLDLLFGNADTPIWLMTLLTKIDLFNLWWVVLVAGGAQVLLRLKKGSAITMAVGIWVLTTVISMLMAMLQGLSAG
jgi:hypothetical protein